MTEKTSTVNLKGDQNQYNPMTSSSEVVTASNVHNNINNDDASFSYFATTSNAATGSSSLSPTTSLNLMAENRLDSSVSSSASETIVLTKKPPPPPPNNSTNINNSTLVNGSSGGGGGWRPNGDWVSSWKSKLPLQTIMRLLQVLVPQVEKICIDKGLTDESEILKFLQNGTLVGLLPVPHPILIRKYQPNYGTIMWFRTYMWGVIYLR